MTDESHFHTKLRDGAEKKKTAAAAAV